MKTEEEAELVNIATYCNTVKVRFGEIVDQCEAKYISDDDVIEFRVLYSKKSGSKTYQYQIPNFNFIITDVEILVNRNTIDTLNEEIFKRANAYV